MELESSCTCLFDKLYRREHQSVVDNLEKYLGPIDIGWSPDVASVGVRVCRFRERPRRDTITYAAIRHLAMNSASCRQFCEMQV